LGARGDTNQKRVQLESSNNYTIEAYQYLWSKSYKFRLYQIMI